MHLDTVKLYYKTWEIWLISLPLNYHTFGGGNSFVGNHSRLLTSRVFTFRLSLWAHVICAEQPFVYRCFEYLHSNHTIVD